MGWMLSHPALIVSVLRFDLERIPQAELHNTRSTLNVRPVRELRRDGRWATRIGGDSPSGTCEVQVLEVLGIGNVDRLPPELQLMAFLPRHLPSLAESEVHDDVVRFAQVIARTGFTRIGVAEARE